MAAVTENNETTTTPSPVKAVPVKEVPTESGDVATNGKSEEKVVENGSSEEKVVENGSAEKKENGVNGHSKENGHAKENGVAKESPVKEAEKRSIDEAVEAESDESSPKKKKVEETTEEPAKVEA